MARGRASHGLGGVLVSFYRMENIRLEILIFCNRGINDRPHIRGMLLFPFGNLSHILSSTTTVYNAALSCLNEGSQTVTKNKDRITLIRYRVYHVDCVNFHLLIDEEQTVLRKNTLHVLPGSIETTGKVPIDTDKRVNFLLCPSCFWCASYFSPDSSFIRCPSCSEVPQTAKKSLERQLMSTVSLQ
jgi:hypothetical protein